MKSCNIFINTFYKTLLSILFRGFCSVSFFVQLHFLAIMSSKRPMGHIAHLRKEPGVLSINTFAQCYGDTITLIKSENKCLESFVYISLCNLDYQWHVYVHILFINVLRLYIFNDITYSCTVIHILSLYSCTDIPILSLYSCNDTHILSLYSCTDTHVINLHSYGSPFRTYQFFFGFVISN